MPLILDDRGRSFGAIEDLTRATGGGSRVLALSLESTLNVFRRSTINSTPLLNNFFNLFQFVTADANGKFKYASIGSKRHVVSSRRKGCTWNPKTCSMDFNIGMIPTYEFEVQEETCPDETWNSCWGQLSAPGLDKNDFYGTPEGAALIRLMIDSTFEAIGNDINEIAWFGNHPIVTKADEGKWYRDCGMTEKQWECFKDTISTCTGLLTTIDSLKAEQLDNYNVPVGNFSGRKYTDTPSRLFDELLERRNQKMILNDGGKNAMNDGGRSMILVSTSIFNAYKRELRESFGNIPQGYYLFTKGADHNCDTCPPMQQNGALEYDGHWIVCMTEWDTLGSYTCTYYHRAILTVPRIFAIASRANQLANQTNGMGMRIVQKLDAPDNGKVYMNAAFEFGTAIVDPDYIVNACDYELLTGKNA